MYGLPYELNAVAELLAMTSLARFYAALPVLSRSLSATLLRSKSFICSMESSASKLVVAAKELRHAELFKDCLLLSIGPWNETYCVHERLFEDPTLTQLASSVLGKISLVICQAQHMLLLAMTGGDKYDIEGHMADALESEVTQVAHDVASDHKSLACLPCFYRRLHGSDLCIEESELKDDHIKPLLENKLILPKFHGVEEDFGCHFLFVEVDDDELPWDRTQTDW